MKGWSGLERVFRLSLGVEVGAHALALIAALEFKQLLQKGLHSAEESSHQPVSLSSEEWCSAAGIFDRKAYDRAKAKLEEQGIVNIQREGRVLRVTLWPNLLPEEPPIQAETSPEPLDNCETNNETTNETPSRTDQGASHPLIPKTNVPSYSLTRSSLNRHPNPKDFSSSSPTINPILINNNQRNNEQRLNEKRENDNPIGPEFRRLWQDEMGHALTSYEELGLQRFIRMGFTEEILIEGLRYAVLAEGFRHPRDITVIQQNWEDQRFIQRKHEPV